MRRLSRRAHWMVHMTADLQKWEFRDSMLVVVIRQQAALNWSCAGCTNARTVQSPFGDAVVRCLKGKPYWQKCKQHEVADE